MTHIVGIIGKAGAGKSTAAQTICDLNAFNLIKFADPLKNMIRTLFYTMGYEEEETERYIEGDLKTTPVDFLQGKTCRQAMQTLGTEWGRECIHNDMWTAAFLARASTYRLVVCDDCRFPNEADLVAGQNGVLIRVVSLLEWNDFVAGVQRDGDPHPSEALMDSVKVHHVVVNDGTIMQLYQNVQGAMFDSSPERRNYLEILQERLS